MLKPRRTPDQHRRRLLKALKPRRVPGLYRRQQRKCRDQINLRRRLPGQGKIRTRHIAHFEGQQKIRKRYIDQVRYEAKISQTEEGMQ